MWASTVCDTIPIAFFMATSVPLDSMEMFSSDKILYRYIYEKHLLINWIFGF